MGRGQKTSQAHRLAIISWLEKKSNYDLITGKAAKGLVVAGKKVKKSDAYKSLADYVNGACKTQWDPMNAKSRYDAYLKTYKDVCSNIKTGSLPNIGQIFERFGFG